MDLRDDASVPQAPGAFSRATKSLMDQVRQLNAKPVFKSLGLKSVWPTRMLHLGDMSGSRPVKDPDAPADNGGRSNPHIGDKRPRESYDEGEDALPPSKVICNPLTIEQQLAGVAPVHMAAAEAVVVAAPAPDLPVDAAVVQGEGMDVQHHDAVEEAGLAEPSVNVQIPSDMAVHDDAMGEADAVHMDAMEEDHIIMVEEVAVRVDAVEEDQAVHGMGDTIDIVEVIDAVQAAEGEQDQGITSDVGNQENMDEGNVDEGDFHVEVEEVDLVGDDEFRSEENLRGEREYEVIVNEDGVVMDGGDSGERATEGEEEGERRTPCLEVVSDDVQEAYDVEDHLLTQAWPDMYETEEEEEEAEEGMVDDDEEEGQEEEDDEEEVEEGMEEEEGSVELLSSSGLLEEEEDEEKGDGEDNEEEEGSQGAEVVITDEIEILDSDSEDQQGIQTRPCSGAAQAARKAEGAGDSADEEPQLITLDKGAGRGKVMTPRSQSPAGITAGAAAVGWSHPNLPPRPRQTSRLAHLTARAAWGLANLTGCTLGLGAAWIAYCYSVDD